METTVRRRKHWGWGYEDQQPSPQEVQDAAAGIRSHLGFEPLEAEEPVPLAEVELPAPRLEPPASLAELCSADPHDRASHSYGRSYRDIVRAFPARFDHPPDPVPFPAAAGHVRRRLERSQQP